MRKLKPLKAQNRVALIFFPAFDWEISPSHPERKERLLYTRDQVFEEGLVDIEGIEEYKADIADEKDILRANICVPSLNTVSTNSHLISAGAAIKAAELVLEGKTDKAFAIVRPPGHHAHRVVHGDRGFCTINNEAVMVEAIRRKYPDKRIAFVDTDAHHADGTQEIYYHDPDVLHISIHQDGRTLYPGTGFINELGGPTAYGRTINIPLLPGTSDEGLLFVIKEFVLPVLSDFKADILINSAGQDNHYSDPLTNMRVSARGYAEMNALLNPDLAVLQGGYSIESALPYVNVGLILAMAGLDYSCVAEPDYNPEELRQDRMISRDIENKVSLLQEIWDKRDSTDLERVFGKIDKFYYREKNIYYDTDGISEFQKEKLRYCQDCPGYLLIDSTAESHYFDRRRIFAVSIPRLTCESCYQEARQQYEKALRQNSVKYDFVYLQDTKSDEYLSNV